MQAPRVNIIFVRIKVYLLHFAFDLVNKLFGVKAPPAPSVSAIVEKDNKILVIDLSYHDGLALPGGFLKGKESFEEALKREIKEETGLKVVGSKYFASYSSLSRIGGFPIANITYLVKTKGELNASREGRPLWMVPEKALRLFVYTDNVEAVKNYLENE